MLSGSPCNCTQFCNIFLWMWWTLSEADFTNGHFLLEIESKCWKLAKSVENLDHITTGQCKCKEGANCSKCGYVTIKGQIWISWIMRSLPALNLWLSESRCDRWEMTSEWMTGVWSMSVLESRKRLWIQPQKCYKDTVKETLCHYDFQPRKLEAASPLL